MLAAAVAAAMIAASSCATKIGTVKKNPGAWVDKKVVVNGTVVKVHLIPNSHLNLLGVEDETDTILVLTDNNVRRGSSVTVSGKIISMGG